MNEPNRPPTGRRLDSPVVGTPKGRRERNGWSPGSKTVRFVEPVEKAPAGERRGEWTENPNRVPLECGCRGKEKARKGAKWLCPRHGYQPRA